MLRMRDLALGAAGALVILVGPGPSDLASLVEHPPPPCVQATGCGHTNAWWDRPVLVAHVALGATPPPRDSRPRPDEARHLPPSPG
jgi:hypothetical protein